MIWSKLSLFRDKSGKKFWWKKSHLTYFWWVIFDIAIYKLHEYVTGVNELISPAYFGSCWSLPLGLVTDGGPPADHRRMLSGLLLKRYVCGQHRQRQSAGPERGTATTHLSNVKLFSQSWIDRFKSELPMTSCQYSLRSGTLWLQTSVFVSVFSWEAWLRENNW